MPHLFTNRRRFHNLFSRAPEPGSHFGWEATNAVLYLVGGLTFVAGSIFFFPVGVLGGLSLPEDSGAWVFFVGSLIYLVVTVHDLLESVSFHRNRNEQNVWRRIELLVAVAYVAGTVLFTVGSVLFLSSVNLTVAGGWCFIVGSLLFLVGAALNVVQILQAGSRITLQLMNATAICFTLGSVIFLVASIPYLWRGVAPHFAATLFTYTSWEYVAGSVLFLAGGGFNFIRAYLAMTHYRRMDRDRSSGRRAQ